MGAVQLPTTKVAYALYRECASQSGRRVVDPINN
jgi:hypothetical protein